MSSTPAIALTGLTKQFRSATAESGVLNAVDDVTLTIERGEIVAVLGPNGAGKSTAIDMILGLTRPTSGTVTVLGRSPAEAINDALIGAVLQTGGLLGELTVDNTLRLVAATYPRHRPVEEHLHRHGLTDLRRRKIARCSGGEQQRLRFALATLGAPQIIVLDEPTAGMDPVKRRQFWGALSEEARHGTTVIFSTHYLEEAEHYAQRVVLLAEGRIIADGPVAEIQRLTNHSVLDADIPPTFDAEIALLPGVSDLRRAGEEISVTCTDADSVARTLLTTTPARRLRIATAGLDDVFFTLTSRKA
ncbi:ABC transporter ATP-binding protein [Corynebacterium uterequi]|uniref:ABC-type multidrug transport system, ATPase component n=1 Tax=Corynebacterium uterequi TaxID=1072256 RepID=A0A0G3HE08_9CORY|nr:ABC transporter ATP-binding protein [Corynebacterium uterequi]AKK10965.1 ABC-type multidrug transport system, ATPase component [Corynebacterium uterequi]